MLQPSSQKWANWVKTSGKKLPDGSSSKKTSNKVSLHFYLVNVIYVQVEIDGRSLMWPLCPFTRCSNSEVASTMGCFLRISKSQISTTSMVCYFFLIVVFVVFIRFSCLYCCFLTVNFFYIVAFIHFPNLFL